MLHFLTDTAGGAVRRCAWLVCTVKREDTANAHVEGVREERGIRTVEEDGSYPAQLQRLRWAASAAPPMKMSGSALRLRRTRQACPFSLHRLSARLTGRNVLKLNKIKWLRRGLAAATGLPGRVLASTDITVLHVSGLFRLDIGDNLLFLQGALQLARTMLAVKPNSIEHVT